MKILDSILKIALIVSVIYSCVPAKKYYEIESNNKYYVNKLEKDSLKISKLTQVNGHHMMRILSLKRDSIKYHYGYDSLFNAYKRTTEMGKMRIANIQRELTNRDIEVTEIEQQSKEIIYSFKSFDVETKTIYRQLKNFFYGYSAHGAHIVKENWDIVITLPDDLIFEDSDCVNLSKYGKRIINWLTMLISKYPKYHIDIIEQSVATRDNYTIVDGVSERIILDTIEYVVDSSQQVLSIPYSYSVEEVTQKEITVEIPASIRRGAVIVEYIESLDYSKNMSYNCVVHTNRAKGDGVVDLGRNVVEIVISPKMTSLLKDIGIS